MPSFKKHVFPQYTVDDTHGDTLPVHNVTLIIDYTKIFYVQLKIKQHALFYKYFFCTILFFRIVGNLRHEFKKSDRDILDVRVKNRKGKKWEYFEYRSWIDLVYQHPGRIHNKA